MPLLPEEAEVGNFRAAAGECEAGEDPSDFSYLLVPEGERETRRSDSLSAITQSAFSVPTSCDNVLNV